MVRQCQMDLELVSGTQSGAALGRGRDNMARLNCIAKWSARYPCKRVTSKRVCNSLLVLFLSHVHLLVWVLFYRTGNDLPVTDVYKLQRWARRQLLGKAVETTVLQDSKFRPLLAASNPRLCEALR